MTSKKPPRIDEVIDLGNGYVVPPFGDAHNHYIAGPHDIRKILDQTTPEIIFPDRKIGHLQEGYEASFLVLDGNPVENFLNVRNIRVRFKQGVFIPGHSAKNTP